MWIGVVCCSVCVVWFGMVIRSVDFVIMNGVVSMVGNCMVMCCVRLSWLSM